MFDRRALYDEILRTVGARELSEARQRIRSRTLRAAIALLVDAQAGKATLSIPHYWAVYYHDGRGSVAPVSARKIVFFNVPEDDPRIAGGYPVRAGDIRRLTRDEYLAGLQENARRRKAGAEPFMFVLDSVGPAAGQPFFDDMAQGAAERSGPTIARIFDTAVQRMIDTDDAVKPETKTAFFDPIL